MIGFYQVYHNGVNINVLLYKVIGIYFVVCFSNYISLILFENICILII